MAIYNSILEVIGRTPLLKLDDRKTGLKNVDLYLKLEYLNPFGSLKDRTSLAMIGEDMLSIQAQNQELVEASSGNTIKAMQAIAGLYGVKTTSVTNRIRVPEIKDILLTMGVKIIEVPGKSSCIDPSNPEDPLYIIGNMMNENSGRYVYPNQYYNEKNPRMHFDTTGQEIAEDLGKVDFLFATLGTTGSSQGVLKRLKEDNPDLAVTGVAAGRDDYIPGIRNQNDLMDVGIYDSSLYNDIVYESSSVAIDGMIDLIRNHGVLAGPTSGVVYAVALQKLREMDARLSRRMNAVVIVCDRMEWYMSYLKDRRPELFQMEPKANGIASFVYGEEDAPKVEVNALKIMIDGEGPLIIDMRSNLAFRSGHIPGALNITDTYLEDLIDNRLPFSRDRKVIVYCARGRNSLRIAAYLKRQGYQAFSLEGGVAAWKERGGALVTVST